MAKNKMNKDLVMNVVLVLILVGILCVSYKLYKKKGFNKEQFTSLSIFTTGVSDTCGDERARADLGSCHSQFICPSGSFKTKNGVLYRHRRTSWSCPDCPDQKFYCLPDVYNCDNHNCIGVNYHGCVKDGDEFKCQTKDGTYDHSKKCCGKDDNSGGEPECDALYDDGCYGDNYQGCEDRGHQRWECKKKDGTYDRNKKCCGVILGTTNGIWGRTPSNYNHKEPIPLKEPINLDGASIQIRNRFYGKIIAYYKRARQLRALPLRYHSQQDYSKWLCEKVGNTNKYRLKNFYTGTYLSSDGVNLLLINSRNLALKWEIRNDDVGKRGMSEEEDNLNRIIKRPSVNIKASMLMTKGYISLRSNNWGTPVFRKIRYQNLDNRARFELIIDFSPPLIAVNKGGEGCTRNNKCNKGEGDCDEDADCKGNLECVQRNSANDTIPGLVIPNNYPAKHDICWNTTTQTPTTTTTTLTPTTTTTTLTPTLAPTTLAPTTLAQTILETTNRTRRNTTRTITGNLIVSSNSINDDRLNDNNITVTGNLTISRTNLINIDFLNNITSVDGNLVISGNDVLTNVDGLSSLTSVGGSLNIWNNTTLTNVDGLSSLTSVGGSISIDMNDALTSLSGLSSITEIGEHVYIINNGENSAPQNVCDACKHTTCRGC
tara:strand:+ start:156 stop:2129 length:1974 start_codon:yes stop_codon:yes gene_type:complete